MIINKMKKNNLINQLLYLTIISGFFGSAFFNIPFGPVTLFMYRLLIMLLVVLSLLMILKNKKIIISHIKVKNYLLFLIFWFIYAVFSLGWAKSRIAAIKDIGFLVFAFAAIFLIAYFFNSLKNYKIFYYIWIVVLIIMLIIGFWNVFTGNHLANSKFKDAPLRFKNIPTAVFYNPNDFATYLAISIPFLLSIFKYKKNHKKLIALLLILSSIFLIIATDSRANYIAVILGLVFWFFFTLNIKFKVKYFFYGLIISTLLILSFPGELSFLINKFFEQISSVFNNQSLGSNEIRINLIKNSLIFLINSFGFGVGAGNAEYYMNTRAIYKTGNILNVHNWWIEIIVNYGLFVFLGYCILFLSISKNLYFIKKNNKINDMEKMITEALLTSLIVFTIASISSSSIIAYKPQWLLFAFSIGFINYYRNKYKVISFKG